MEVGTAQKQQSVRGGVVFEASALILTHSICYHTTTVRDGTRGRGEVEIGGCSSMESVVARG